MTEIHVTRHRYKMMFNKGENRIMNHQ